jgi:RNA polymerase sigma-70 factor, ECF subfamily
MGRSRDLRGRQIVMDWRKRVRTSSASLAVPQGRPPECGPARMVVTPPSEVVDLERVIREIQEGIDTERNFSRLYNCFHPRLLRHFMWRGVPPEAAEDLCQEVFFHAFRKLGSFEGRSRFERWLYEIAHNIYANELRRWAAEKRKGCEVLLKEEHELADDDSWGRAPALIAGGPSPYDEVRWREQTAKLRAAIEALPPQQRNCVYLRVYQGLKYREVAEVMNISLDTVKAHLGAAKKLLQQLLSVHEEYGELGVGS